jgi:pyruvate dehydrogenase E1 component alpha subunit
LPENPLLPNRKLRELYALIERCRALDRRRPHPTAREALLAATTLQLLPGDLLLAEAGDRTVAALAPKPKSVTPTPSATLPAPRLPLAAAMAHGLQAAGAGGLVLAFAHAGASEPGWAGALEWAHEAKLPLLLACADSTGGASSNRASKDPPLNWLNMQRLAKKLHLPVFAVDGEDAVAVYRVMQESVLRARAGGGPAVFWAVLSPQRPARADLPLARLRSYLAARRIPLLR